MNVDEVIGKIEELNKVLESEYEVLAKKYGFEVSGKKVIFSDSIKEEHRKSRVPLLKYLIPKSVRHVISVPFIYMVIIPIVILDFFISIYHFVAFPLFGIPYVKRNDYVYFDRQFLSYLNLLQKAHCLYCSYVNGLLAYAVEIGVQTERYWCPVKAAHRKKLPNHLYQDYADYGNVNQWKEKFNHIKEKSAQLPRNDS